MRVFSCVACIISTVAFCISVSAQIKQTIAVKGLSAPVEVWRDQWGVNHIYAANQHDLFYCQGYCAAKDRLFQFEIWRRQATGIIAELLGRTELKRDIGARLFMYRGDMNKEFSHYHPEGKNIIYAFTEGINRYIDEVNHNPTLLPEEFRLLHIQPGKWTPEVVISRHQGILGNITEELNIGRAVAIAGEEKVKDMMWFHPKQPDLNIDTSIDKTLLFDNILELYTAYRREVIFSPGSRDLSDVYNNNHDLYDHPFEHGLEGSNNWTISGSRTSDGHPLLANDPHRKIAIPSLRYIVHLSAPGWNVMGGGEPEIPGVAIGHNKAGAWGITISETDGEDLYVYNMNPSNLNQYWYKDKWVSMKEIKEIIPVKGEQPVEVILRYTIHGPVTYIDSAHHKAYAVRSASLEPGGAPYLSALRIDQSSSWETFRTACSYSHIPALNMVWADTAGRIGWQTVGIVPVRKNFSGMVPVAGDGRYEWSGYLPIKERPHEYNPAKGFFATANQDLVPKDYNHWDAIGYTWADAFRGDRINQLLSSDNQMNIAKAKAMQTDYYSVPASLLIPMLTNIPFGNQLTQEAKDSLLHWNFVLNKNSVAAAIYVMWERTLMQEANKQLIPENIRLYLSIQTTKLMQWLKQPGIRFGKDSIKGRDLFLKTAFEKAITALQQKLGDTLVGWQYGQAKFKHTAFIHPLSGLASKEWQQKLNTDTLPRGGYGHSIGSTGDADNQATGASFRMITSVGNWDSTIMTNSPGQSGNPDSPFYKNLFSSWANDEYFPGYFSKEKIEAVAIEKWNFIPKADKRGK